MVIKFSIDQFVTLPFSPLSVAVSVCSYTVTHDVTVTRVPVAGSVPWKLAVGGLLPLLVRII